MNHIRNLLGAVVLAAILCAGSSCAHAFTLDASVAEIVDAQEEFNAHQRGDMFYVEHEFIYMYTLGEYE